MAEFMRPTVTTEEVNDTVARFIVEPLERGFGYTLGTVSYTHLTLPTIA